MKTAYELSNDIQNVVLNRFRSDLSHDFLSSGDSVSAREKNAQKLVDYLCDKFKMPHCHVIISNKRQLHSLRSGKLSSKKPVAINTMYDTLLHEFIHHYDMTKLKLSSSPHTKGFYMRISDIKAKLAG